MRRQLAGPAEIEAALRAGESLRLVLVRRGARDPSVHRLLAQARAAGAAVRAVSENDLRRMSRLASPTDLLALVGPPPEADPEAVLTGEGVVWLVVGIRYPGNAGFAIRTAEVSGASGVFVDARFDADGRKRALRASMHAERFLPVHWAPAEWVLERARAAHRRVLAIEDVGTHAPWETDLTGRVLFIIGGERGGIPAALLACCDAVLRIPMSGFIPSYNLQAALAAVAIERLRQAALPQRQRQ